MKPIDNILSVRLLPKLTSEYAEASHPEEALHVFQT